MLDKLGSIWKQSITNWESVQETLSYFSASAKLESYDAKDGAALQEFLKCYEKCQDSIVIKLFLDEDESYEFSNRMSLDSFEERIQEFIDELSQLDGEEELSVQLEINKKLDSYADNVLVDNIYSINAWSNYLESLSLEELHRQIYKRYHSIGIEGVILLGDYTSAYNTDFFHFIPRTEFSYDLFRVALSRKRVDDLLALRSSLGHFANASEWQFLPDHFKFSGSAPSDLKLVKTTFNALHNVYLISFLADFTIIDNGKVEYTLKGFKDIIGEYELAALKSLDASSLWELYQWIYQANSVDKIGITRNVIPLHVEELLKVNDAVLASAYSGFNLSQKDDVKSYIESTNKLSEQVLTTFQKANDIAEKVANSIKTGVWAISTFIVSTLLFRIFSKGSDIESFSNLFAFIGSPLFVVIISFALLMFSCLFGLAWYESVAEQKRFKEMYDDSKKVYRNVLTEDDINRILSDDECYLLNDSYITKKRSLYTWIWLGTLSVAITVLVLASCYANKQSKSQGGEPITHEQQMIKDSLGKKEEKSEGR